jgi:Txe/YoeB family toxin of Txe-Axe toxin-antitoxin module
MENTKELKSNDPIMIKINSIENNTYTKKQLTKLKKSITTTIKELKKDAYRQAIHDSIWVLVKKLINTCNKTEKEMDNFNFYVSLIHLNDTLF